GRDVLLELHLLVVAEVAAVELLLEHPELVAEHHDLLEEDVERDALFLRALATGLEDHLTSRPPLADRDLTETQLLEDDLAENLTELILIHVDVDLLRDAHPLHDGGVGV